MPLPSEARQFLDWTTPFDDAVIDAFAGASLAGGVLRIALASGATVEAMATIPAAGVLRLVIGGDPKPSSMLVEIAATPATLESVADGVRFSGPGVDAVWDARGLRCGAYRHAARHGIVRGGRTSDGWVEAFHIEPDAAIYGGGESFQGPNLRGRMRRLINREAALQSGFDLSYLNVPLLWSDAGWGLFVHTGAPSIADVGHTHSESGAFGVQGNVLDLFLITGDAPTILRRYHELTGLPGRFPDWGLGVWMSRCSYVSAAEIEGEIDALRDAGCKPDVVHVDWWMTGDLINDLTCEFEPDRERFPPGWTQRIDAKVSLWHNPYVKADSPVANALRAQGLLALAPDGTPAVTSDMPRRWIVDFTNPAALEWWRERIRATVSSEHNHAFKPDFAEEIPLDAVFHDGRTGRELRNEYANLYQDATHGALEEVALFCRSGTSGAQRYPCHWIGDTPSTWDGLTTAVRAMLSLSLSGFAHVASDVGGFVVLDAIGNMTKALAAKDPSPFTADVEPELYGRWSQFGALSPVMRYHGTGRREPTAYPLPGREMGIAACQYRERLRPYLERVSAEASRDGTPMMRAMPYAYPGDRTARDADLQYLLGPDLLVAPVLAPGGERRVWVPPGAWEGVWGLGDVTGPGWTTVRCALDAYPVWRRAGSDVPLAR